MTTSPLNIDTASSLAADGAALARLKRSARSGGVGAVQQAAQQFEAVFVGMLLKSMRDTMPKDGMLSSSQSEMFTGMFDQQVAQKISARGLGLADVIARQLSKQTDRDAASRANAVPSQTPAAPTVDRPATVRSGAAKVVSAAATPIGGNDRAAFVSRMLTHAREAERQSGVPASFAVGQAALESGWGRREIVHADGRSTHNLFGIKAGRDWKGPTVEVATIEYVGGSARRVVEKFRVYASYAEAFADHARLIGNSPRYQAARVENRSAQGFADAIQRAGYATDPRYAEKLGSVIRQVARMADTATAAQSRTA